VAQEMPKANSPFDSIYFCPLFRIGDGDGTVSSGILMMMLIARYKLNMQNSVEQWLNIYFLCAPFTK